MPDYLTDEAVKGFLMPENHTTHFHRSGSPECLPGATCCAVDALAREVLGARNLIKELSEPSKTNTPWWRRKRAKEFMELYASPGLDKPERSGL